MLSFKNSNKSHFFRIGFLTLTTLADVFVLFTIISATLNFFVVSPPVMPLLTCVSLAVILAQFSVNMKFRLPSVSLLSYFPSNWLKVWFRKISGFEINDQKITNDFLGLICLGSSCGLMKSDLFKNLNVNFKVTAEGNFMSDSGVKMIQSLLSVSPKYFPIIVNRVMGFEDLSRIDDAYKNLLLMLVEIEGVKLEKLGAFIASLLVLGTDGSNQSIQELGLSSVQEKILTYIVKNIKNPLIVRYLDKGLHFPLFDGISAPNADLAEEILGVDAMVMVSGDLAARLQELKEDSKEEISAQILGKISKFDLIKKKMFCWYFEVYNQKIALSLDSADLFLDIMKECDGDHQSVFQLIFNICPRSILLRLKTILYEHRKQLLDFLKRNIDTEVAIAPSQLIQLFNMPIRKRTYFVQNGRSLSEIDQFSQFPSPTSSDELGYMERASEYVDKQRAGVSKLVSEASNSQSAHRSLAGHGGGGVYKLFEDKYPIMPEFKEMLTQDSKHGTCIVKPKPLEAVWEEICRGLKEWKVPSDQWNQAAALLSRVFSRALPAELLLGKKLPDPGSLWPPGNYSQVIVAAAFYMYLNKNYGAAMKAFQGKEGLEAPQELYANSLQSFFEYSADWHGGKANCSFQLMNQLWGQLNAVFFNHIHVMGRKEIHQRATALLDSKILRKLKPDDVTKHAYDILSPLVSEDDSIEEEVEKMMVDALCTFRTFPPPEDEEEVEKMMVDALCTSRTFSGGN
ncbi:MAG: hypothetical protein FJ186_04440 [Gammaproteobacteria bacterium]|nr:hypothetical protein [Gammaproteobacteria bacterium]